jgi:hypothetical protein
MPAMEALENTAQADCIPRLNSRKYRQLLNSYGFVASPPGNGIDCHRTWEALYLGVVPILKKSIFYSFFPDLPAIFVDDWKEIVKWDCSFLRRCRMSLATRFETTPYLRFDYWAGLIAEAKKSLIARIYSAALKTHFQREVVLLENTDESINH